MSKFLKTVLIIVTLFLVNSISAQEQKTVKKAIIKTAIACDHCKICETCGGLLEKKLLRQKGVQMITLDEKKMTIEVIYNSKKIDLATIKAEISKMGYDADEVKGDALAYEKLDSCCKA